MDWWMAIYYLLCFPKVLLYWSKDSCATNGIKHNLLVIKDHEFLDMNDPVILIAILEPTHGYNLKELHSVISR